MLCKHNVRMASWGVSELERFFELDHHLTDDQRFFPGIVLGKRTQLLHGEKLGEARKKYAIWRARFGSKTPLKIWRCAEEPFASTGESDKIRIQIHLFKILLRIGGEIWGLKVYWTQVGVLTANSASTADLSWSPDRNTVCMTLFGQYFWPWPCDDCVKCIVLESSRS